jgi:hypothetical protein
MPRRLGRLGWLVVALIFVGFAIGSIAINAARTGCHIFSVDGNAYEAANRETLAPVPLYPGSQLGNSGSTGEPHFKRCFPMENSGPYKGFRTYVNYSVPRPTKAADVYAFYDRYFAREGWTRSASSTGLGFGSQVRYTRGTVYVSLRPVIGSYSLTADHDTTD